uniref:Uncharacterized protein n=1 Tax=Meloidogyne javanica TaxID=6303 RepID=A0A915N8T2_MELJA
MSWPKNIEFPQEKNRIPLRDPFRNVHWKAKDGENVNNRVYRVGSQYGWSSIFSFVGLEERPEGGYRFAVYGDMGNVNARSLGKLQREAQNGDFDMILHVGM